MERAGQVPAGAHMTPDHASVVVLRDLVLEREPFLDVRPLGADRFGTAAGIRPETHIV